MTEYGALFREKYDAFQWQPTQDKAIELRLVARAALDAGDITKALYSTVKVATWAYIYGVGPQKLKNRNR